MERGDGTATVRLRSAKSERKRLSTVFGVFRGRGNDITARGESCVRDRASFKPQCQVVCRMGAPPRPFLPSASTAAHAQHHRSYYSCKSSTALLRWDPLTRAPLLSLGAQPHPTSTRTHSADPTRVILSNRENPQHLTEKQHQLLSQHAVHRSAATEEALAAGAAAEREAAEQQTRWRACTSRLHSMMRTAATQ